MHTIETSIAELLIEIEDDWQPSPSLGSDDTELDSTDAEDSLGGLGTDDEDDEDDDLFALEEGGDDSEDSLELSPMPEDMDVSSLTPIIIRYERPVPIMDRLTVRRDGDTYRMDFESYGQFIDYAQYGTTDLPVEERSSMTDHTVHIVEWTQSESLEQACELARAGWLDGAQRIQEYLNVLQAQVQTRRIPQELVMHIVGPGTLDMGRYIAGHPEPWVVWQQCPDETDNGQIIDITYNCGVNAGVNKDAIFQNGAILIALIDMLESNGYRVALTTIETTLSTNDLRSLLHVTVPIKRAEDPLDIARIAFIAHPAFQRRLGFSVEEQIPAAMRKVFSISSHKNYGRSVAIDSWGDSLIINSQNLGNDISGIRRYIAEQLERYGIILEDA